jgi:hypothetical protein
VLGRVWWTGWVVLLPIVAIVFPLFRLVPPLYRWRIRSASTGATPGSGNRLELEEKQGAPACGYAGTARPHRAPSIAF